MIVMRPPFNSEIFGREYTRRMDSKSDASPTRMIVPRDGRSHAPPPGSPFGGGSGVKKSRLM